MSPDLTATAATVPVRRPAGEPCLSFAQERMFLLEQMTPGVTAYNVPRLLTIGGTLDESLLQHALDVVSDRHETLRTTIALVDGVPTPRIDGGRPIQLAVTDLRRSGDAETRCAELASELAWRPFDLEREPMLRAALFHLDDGDRLLLVSHHLVSDHASFPILLGELAEVYAARAAGRQPQLPELPITYSDFAAWQRERLSGDAVAADLEYWRERLTGAPDRIDLPSDRPRPAAMSYEGGQRTRRLAPETVAALRAYARSSRVSFFTVLLAAVQTLLHRYTGQEDVVVGSPASGRHHEETQQLIGFFSNTLVLRTAVSADATFDELTRRARDGVLGALAHQDLPFERIVEAVNPKRDLSHTPLFQVLLTHDVVAPPLELAGLPARVTPLPETRWSRFDLSLGAHDLADGGLEIVAEYSTDLFDAATIDRLLGHFETLLTAVAADPSRAVGEVPLLTEDERGLLLERWNDTARPLAGPERIEEVVAAQAAATPDAVAVEGSGVRITYGELDARASQLAHRLRALGVGGGDLVAVSTDRCAEMMVAFLGVLKAGAAYVPVDPTYPRERQAFMLADSEARVLVTQEALIERLPGSTATIVCLDRDRHELDRLPATSPATDGDGKSLAYVIYTSGSTGLPKGVEIEHRSVVNLLTVMRETPGLAAGEVLVNVTTAAFDLSVPDLYLPLTCGARLVVMPRDVTVDGRRLGDALAEVGATFMQATPTTWAMLLESGWQGLEGLKIVCGGEALPRGLANRLCGLGASLWHMYGPTETTVWSAILPLHPGEGPPPIGGPIANTRFYVVDDALQPVPVGIPGELLIGGSGVARGYRNRSDLTADRFLPDPFAGEAGARVYRTGDQVRRRADGTLEFLGRLDQQVKLHGFRIELEEVEAVLDRHPEVRASVAAVRDGAADDKLLVAYVVLEPAATVSTEALRRHLAATLPAYAVPSVLVELDALPVTANGKLDRAALPAPEVARPVLEQPYVPARTPTEELLVEIWESLLPVDRVGIDDDFFDLGGHSMLALRLVARIKDRLDVDLFLTAVFEHPTVRELAEVVAVAMLESSEEGLEALLDELEAAEA